MLALAPSRFAIVAGATLAMAAVPACQLLLPFQEGAAEADGSAPANEGGADVLTDVSPMQDVASDAGDASPGEASTDACTPGACKPVSLAGGQSTPSCLRLYAGEVYWGTSSGLSNSGVWHVPVDGGVPQMLVAAAYISGLTVGPNGVYWADPGGIETYGDAGATTFVGMTSPQMVTADDASVYWSDWSGSKPIYSEPLGMPAASPSTPLYGSNTGTAFGLVFYGGNLYWTENDTYDTQGLVVFGSIAGGATPTTLAQMQANPLGISVDPTGVYWANSGIASADGGAQEQAVWSEQPAGSTPQLIAGNLNHPVAVWADPNGPYVYWAEQGSLQDGYSDGRIARASKTGGGNVTVLAAGQAQPVDLTGDDTWIYWANAGALVDGGHISDGEILKLPK